MKFEWAYRLHEWVWDGPLWRLLLAVPVLLITLPFVLLGGLFDLASRFR